MDELDKEIEKLDIKISEIQHSVGCIKELLTNSKMAEKSIDISNITKLAHANVLTNHRISQLDDNLGYKYCCALASFSLLVDNQKQKVTQLLFVLRIYYAKGQNLSTDDFVRDMNLLSTNDWDSLIQELDDETTENLFVDLIMMIHLCPDVNENQMEFLCQLAALAGKNETDFALYAKIVRAILQQKKEDLFDLVNDSKNVNQYRGYFKDSFTYSVVGKLEDIPRAKNDMICLWKTEIRDREEILDIDVYKKSEIHFEGCVFDNIKGIVGKQTHSIFYNCIFSNNIQQNLENNSYRQKYKKECEQKYLINLENALLSECKFSYCSIEGCKNESSIVWLTNSEMKRCVFDKCKIGIHDHQNSTGAIVYLNKSQALNCQFLDCHSYGEGEYGEYDYFYMRILEVRGGKTLDNFFGNCECSAQDVYNKTYRNYILAYQQNSRVEKNHYDSCECSQCKYNDNFKHDMECLID